MLLEDLIIELETLRTQYGGDMEVKMETPILDPAKAAEYEDCAHEDCEHAEPDTCLGAHIEQGPLRYVLLERE